MKKSFFKRFKRPKAKGVLVDKAVATSDDIRKKLEGYERKEGPANFGSAGLYSVNEMDDSEPVKDKS